MSTAQIAIPADQADQINAILQEVVDGYRRDTLETLEGIRQTLNQMHAQPDRLEHLDLGVMVLHFELAGMKLRSYLRTAQLLNDTVLGPAAPVLQSYGLLAAGGVA